MIFGIGLVLALAHVYQFYLWFQRWRRWKSIPNTIEIDSNTLPALSVIIAAKNEEQNIPLYLPQILEQDYPHFEVIVVDDQSLDMTLRELEKLTAQYFQLQVLTTSPTIHGKKAALGLGIAESKGEWIVCTDADCRPCGPNWLRTLLAEHQFADVILGYGKYESGKTFLNQFLCYETGFIASQYFTQAIRGKPYMGVGRNLAYRKKVFIENNGFGSHQEIKSGDDDLFISSLTDARVKIQVDPESWTISHAPDSWSALWQQKRRHLTTAPRYSFQIKAELVLEFLSQFLIYCLSAFFILNGMWWVLILLLFRVMSLYAFSKSSMADLGVKKLHLSIPFWDLVLCLYYSLQGIGMLWPKKNW